MDSADGTDDGAVDISDPVFILLTLFMGEGSIPPPHPGEGFDPTLELVACGAKRCHGRLFAACHGRRVRERP